MNMLRFFDYVYYRACLYYARHKEREPKITGLLILSESQLCNLLSLAFLFAKLANVKMGFSKYYIFIPVVLVMVLNGIRYNKLTYELLKEKWSGEAEQEKNRRGTIVLAYIVLSNILCLSLAILFGGKK